MYTVLTRARFRDSKDCNWTEMCAKLSNSYNNTYPARKDQRENK